MSTKRGNDEIDCAMSGDPGVGGLLADPLATDTQRDKIDQDAGEPSADPSPPRHHHDWSPNKQPGAEKEELPDAE